MNGWDITASRDLLAGLARLNTSTTSTKSFSVSNSTGFSSDYAKILAQKIAQVEEDFKTAKDNLSQQNQISVSENSMPVIETIKRFRPDGSIMITTYEDGSIASTTKIKPHLVPMPDFSAPKTPEGKTAIKMVPQLSVAELLML